MTKDELKTIKQRVKQSQALTTLCNIGTYSSYWSKTEKDEHFSRVATWCQQALEQELGYTVAITEHKVFIIVDRELLPIYSS